MYKIYVDELKPFKKAFLDAYDKKIDPKFNGGHYVSGSDWNIKVNDIISELLNRKVRLSAGTLNAICQRLDTRN